MSLKVSLVSCFWVKVKQEHIKNSVKFYVEQKLNIRQNFFDCYVYFSFKSLEIGFFSVKLFTDRKTIFM